jgi:signal peptidase I
LYELSDAMRIVLENGGEVSFVTAGVSMLPLLRNRMDTAFLHKPVDPIRRGDVIFYRTDNGKYILHRVVGKRKDGFVTRGDNLRVKEYGVRKDQVLAVLTAVRRGDKLIPMHSARNRLYVWCLPLVRLFRHRIYPLYVRFLAPLVRKIKK